MEFLLAEGKIWFLFWETTSRIEDVPSVTYPCPLPKRTGPWVLRITAISQDDHIQDISLWNSASIYFLVFLHWCIQEFNHATEKSGAWSQESTSRGRREKCLVSRNNGWWGSFDKIVLMEWYWHGPLGWTVFVKSWTVNDKTSQMLSMHQDSQS